MDRVSLDLDRIRVIALKPVRVKSTIYKNCQPIRSVLVPQYRSFPTPSQHRSDTNFVLSMRFFPLNQALCGLSIVTSCLSNPIASSANVPNAKPVIVIVPAAWHSPIHYSEYARQLRFAGYQTVSQRLPSCDSSHPESQSLGVDAAFIRQYLLAPSINAGKEVILVMHSYSGGPGAVAAKGLSVAERRTAGQAGGIVGLIFIAAFIAKEGQTMLSGSAGKFAPWVIEYVSASKIALSLTLLSSILLLTP